MAEKYVMLKHSLAKALMDAGVHHLDAGGGVVGGGGSGGVLSDVSGALTTQNTFQAQAPTNASTVGAQQAALAGQLQNEAAGNGPNPAQIQYQQNAQKIAQEQAQMNAQNRALNPAIAARLSSNAAVNAGQNAASGAAAQQAMQQLEAQKELQGLTGQEQTGSLQASGINAQVAQNNSNAVNNTEGGLFNSIGGAAKSIFGFSKGGVVPPHLEHLKKMADIYHPQKFAVGGTIQMAGVPTFSNAQLLTPLNLTPGLGTKKKQEGSDDIESDMPEGLDAIDGSAPIAAAGLKAGGKIPGKAAVKGDSEKNDTIPALVSPGEEVIDRETMNDPGPIGKMARTVAQHIAKKNGQDQGGGKASDFVRSLMEKDGKDDGQKDYEKVAEAKKKRAKK